MHPADVVLYALEDCSLDRLAVRCPSFDPWLKLVVVHLSCSCSRSLKARGRNCAFCSHIVVYFYIFFLPTFGSLKHKMKSVWSVCRLVWQIRFFFFIMQWAARLLLRVIDRPLDIAAISTWTVDFGLLTALLMSLAPYRCRTKEGTRHSCVRKHCIIKGLFFRMA